MNTNFLRQLAERLEHMCWVEVKPAECLFVEFFDSMDGFFMSSDLVCWDRPPGFIFGDDDYFIGGIEDWAVELIQERHGFYDDYEHEDDAYEHWVDVEIDDAFSERHVWLLACQALGLGEKAAGGGFAVNEELANALLRPSGLYGRLRGVTPRMAAEVLRCCAGGVPPQDAWALVGQALRERRLRELADVVEKAEPGAPVAKVGDWSHADLAEKLKRFSMLRPYEPWITADGHWCGDLSVWAYRLYGATAELSFGPDARDYVLPVSGNFLGLAVLEALALFEAGKSPCQADDEAFRRMLTPQMVSEALRRVAGGVFPSLAWDAICRRLGLDAGAGEDDA